MMKILKKLSAIVMVASSMCGIGISGFSTDSIAASAEDASSLEPGIYAVNLYRNTTDVLPKSTSNYTSKAQNFYLGRAMLEVKEDQTQTLTIGVENWSCYDKFAVLNQEHTADYLNAGYSLSDFPEGFFSNDSDLTYSITSQSNEDGTVSYDVLRDTEKAKEMYSTNSTLATNVDSYFNYNVDVDETTGKDYDIAYVSFPISDYQDRIYVYNWFNAATNYNLAFSSLYNSSIIWIEPSSVQKIDISNADFKYSVANLYNTKTRTMQCFDYANEVNPLIFYGSVSSKIVSSSGNL